MLNNTVDSSSDQSTVELSSSDSTDSSLKHARFQRQMEQLADSIRQHGITYYRCVKASSQWFVDIKDEIVHLAESKEGNDGIVE